MALAQPQMSGVTQFFEHPEPFQFRGGGTLDSYRLAYQTWGELNDSKDNAVLVFHALTGSQNAAGFTKEVEGVAERWTEECQKGWWEGFIGSGMALDTDKYFVICANYLGGCYGSTGPSSIDPSSGKPFGSSFPRVGLADIVDSQIPLIDSFGIDRLHAVVGPSVGGMLCMSLATRYPERVLNVMPLGSGISASPLQRLHNFEQILAIESDAHFAGGDYYEGPLPTRGLALARMIGHKTFISINTLKQRARDEIEQPDGELSWYEIGLSLESYMLHAGSKFVKRFDANTYLRIMDAWQNFDPITEAGAASAETLFKPCADQRYLLFTIDSDVCFYPEQQAEIESCLVAAGVRQMRITVHSEKGHDSFLLEPDLYTPQIAYALEGR